MTDQEIIMKSIRKAAKNGFVVGSTRACCEGGEAKEHDEARCYEKIIFSHGFAKAFWGNEFKDVKWSKYISDEGSTQSQMLQAWQYHLTQMVLEPEPLQYLSKFLEVE